MNDELLKVKSLVDMALINKHSKSQFTSCSALESDLVKYISGVNSILSNAQDYLIQNANARDVNRERVRGLNINIISLGYDCLPRTLLTRWGLKMTKNEGELSYPFDLAVHPTPVVSYLLDSNFKNYIDGDIEIVNGVPRNTKVGVNFNHETGVRFVENNCELLRSKYSARISNFNNLSSERGCVFVHHVSQEKAIPSLIKSVVKNRREKESNDLLIFLKTDSIGFSKTIVESCRSEGVVLLHVPKPSVDYVWHLEEHYSTEEGRLFENGIADLVLEYIESNYHST